MELEEFLAQVEFDPQRVSGYDGRAMQNILLLQ